MDGNFNNGFDSQNNVIGTYDNVNSTNVTNTNAYGNQQNAYGNQQNAYGNQQNAYGNQQNAYGNQQNTYANTPNNANIYSNNSFQNTTSSYGSIVQERNIIFGIIGGIIGAIPGAILWVIINQLGYISGIAGAFIVVGSMMGYQKLKKGMGVGGMIYCMVLSAGAIFLINHICYALELLKVFSTEFTDAELRWYGYKADFGFCFSNLLDILEYADVKGSYIADLVIGYVLTVICSIGFLKK